MSSGGRLRKMVKRYRESLLAEQVENSVETVQENPEELEDILVHGYFVYECEACGKVYKMWLEKGLEDTVQDKAFPENHKPVPFIIGCECGGACKHILWGIGDDTRYEYLKKGESYFSNSEENDCGKSVLRKSYGGLKQFERELWKEKFGGMI